MRKSFNILSNIVKPQYTGAAATELTTNEKVVHNALHVILEVWLMCVFNTSWVQWRAASTNLKSNYKMWLWSLLANSDYVYLTIHEGSN